MQAVNAVFKTLNKGKIIGNALVVDNSVMMRWLFKDGSAKDQNYAQSVLGSIDSENLHVIVPYLWVYEASFVVSHYFKRGCLSHRESTDKLQALFNLSMIIRGEETPQSLYEFSSEYGLSTYDSAYALLAITQACPLASLDQELIKVAGKAKYKLFAK